MCNVENEEKLNMCAVFPLKSINPISYIAIEHSSGFFKSTSILYSK